MSGVFGFIPNNINASIPGFIQKMGQMLTHREWHQVDTWSSDDESISMGRIGIGIFNSELQPTTAANDRLVLFFTGELQRHNLTNWSLEISPGISKLSDPELILDLYQTNGKDCFEALEGTYQLALLDLNEEKLYITNDRWGTYPLFYAQGSFGLIFAPEYKTILAHPQFQKEIDFDSLAEYVRFQKLMGEKTFFKNIHRIYGASILVLNLKTHQLQREIYYDFSVLTDPGHSLNEAAENTSRLLIDAVNRRMSDDYSTGVYLSGGADSRQIAAISARNSNIHTITYGNPDSKDCHFAAMTAKAINSTHHQFNLDTGSWILDNFHDHLMLTEGFHSWFNMHGISTIHPMREHIQVQMNGFCGDHLYFPRARQNNTKVHRPNWHRLNFQIEIFNSFSQGFTWPNVNESEALHIYASGIKNQMRDRAYETLRTEWNKTNHLHKIHQWFHFILQNHAMSLTHYYNVFFRAGMEIRLPFLDYDLFTYINSLPGELRYGKSAEYAFRVIDSVIPEVTHIPYAKDSLPLTMDKRKLLIGTAKLKARLAAKRIFPNQVKNRPSLSVDYENLLRRDLKNWAADILFDDRTLDRGLFNPDYLRILWKSHQSGELHTIGKFAPIITYEMLLREFYD